MTQKFVKTARDTRPTAGHKTCEPCAGMGFRRTGDFADRKFVRCADCKGLGQAYLERVAHGAE